MRSIKGLKLCFLSPRSVIRADRKSRGTFRGNPFVGDAPDARKHAPSRTPFPCNPQPSMNIVLAHVVPHKTVFLQVIEFLSEVIVFFF